jgi:hypothetical protein
MIQGKSSLHILATLSVFAGLALLPAPPAGRRGPLGPIASFAATVQWARADAAIDGGRLDVGLARAERALELDPAPSEGWSWLAGVLVHRFGAPEFEANPMSRRTWVEAGLAVLARGESVTREPEELAFHAGLIMAFVAALPEEVLEWPGGAHTAWIAAAEHFERAKSLGHTRADDAAQAAWKEVHWPTPDDGESGGPPTPQGTPKDKD